MSKCQFKDRVKTKVMLNQPPTMVEKSPESINQFKKSVELKLSEYGIFSITQVDKLKSCLETQKRRGV